MSIREWVRLPLVRAALALCAASLALSAWMVASGLRDEPMRPLPPSQVSDPGALAAITPPPPADLEAAMDNDVFSPERTAPAHAYRMPGEPSLADTASADAPKPIVLGTAVAGDGASFATCQLGNENPRIVRVGDRVGEYTVKAIERGRVVFQRRTGARLDVAQQKPQA